MLTRELNWADDYTFSAARDIADFAGYLIDLGGIDQAFCIDPERWMVVGAATNYGVGSRRAEQTLDRYG